MPIDRLPDRFRFSLDDGDLAHKVSEVELNMDTDKLLCNIEWKPVRAIPTEKNWFENIWNEYLKDGIIK